MGNPFGRSVVLPLTNQSGGSVAAGDFVYLDTGHNDAFITGTTSAYTGAIGVAQQAIGAGSVGLVLVQGYASLVNVNASVTRGNFGKGYTVAKQATDAGSSRVAGTFCQFLTGGTTPDAMIWQPDLGAGSGLSDPMTTRGDVIVRNASNVTARLAIGSSGKVLSSDGTDVSWQTPSSGGDTEFAEATRTAGDLTTTSTSFVDATGITVTLTTAAVRCRVIVIAAVSNSGVNSTCLDIAVDGTLQGQANGLTFSTQAGPTSACFEYITGVLSAASHTIKLQWRVTGGTGTLYASTGVSPLKIQVIETNLVA